MREDVLEDQAEVLDRVGARLGDELRVAEPGRFHLVEEELIGAAGAADRLLGEELVTHNYVVVELVSLVRRRLGAAAAVRLIDDVLPALDVVDVEAGLRLRAISAFRAAADSGVSMVDRTSFEFMRERGIRRAWAFDADFGREGFELEK